VLTCLTGFVLGLPRQVPLGLELEGGAHLLLAMDGVELRRNWLGTLRDDARMVLRGAKIPASTAVGPNAVQVRLRPPEAFQRGKCSMGNCRPLKETGRAATWIGEPAARPSM
jgi:preprotein translocase subunit SecD